MKVYFNSSSVYQNNQKNFYSNSGKNSNRNYLLQTNPVHSREVSPSFGATFFKTVATHIGIGASSGAGMGAYVGGSVDLGTAGATMGLASLSATAVGSIIGGASGLVSGTVNYFVDKKNEAALKKLEADNKKLAEDKAELERKEKALKESEAMSDTKNKEALEKQRKTLEANQKLIDILQKYNTKELNTRKGVGLGTTAGYAEDKAALNEVFLSPFRKSFDPDNYVNEQIPNGILLYGLSGNGKTTLAKGMIDELMNDPNTDTVFYDLSDVSRKDLQKELSKIKEKSEVEFKETGRRTIILMDEFDGIAPNPGKITQILKGEEAENVSNAYLKNFMNDCSDYGITIIATTNYPQNIESPFIINNKRFEVKTVIEPPNANDMYQILEYYLDGVTDGEINYQEAVNLLVRNSRNKEAKYSCSAIKSIADKAKAFAKKEKRLVNQDDILRFADKSKPDLSKKYMEQFKEDFECVTGSTYEEYLAEKAEKEREE